MGDIEKLKKILRKSLEEKHGAVIENFLQLISDSENINAADEKGATLFHFLTQNYCNGCCISDIFDELEACKYGRIDMSAQDEDGYTALHIAVMRCDIAAVKEFIEMGFQIGDLDDDDNTALDLAVSIADKSEVEEFSKFIEEVEEYYPELNFDDLGYEKDELIERSTELMGIFPTIEIVRSLTGMTNHYVERPTDRCVNSALRVAIEHDNIGLLALISQGTEVLNQNIDDLLKFAVKEKSQNSIDTLVAAKSIAGSVTDEDLKLAEKPSILEQARNLKFIKAIFNALDKEDVTTLNLDSTLVDLDKIEANGVRKTLNLSSRLSYQELSKIARKVKELGDRGVTISQFNFTVTQLHNCHLRKAVEEYAGKITCCDIDLMGEDSKRVPTEIIGFLSKLEDSSIVSYEQDDLFHVVRDFEKQSTTPPSAITRKRGAEDLGRGLEGDKKIGRY
jgi:ankyrin repeat protein